MKTIMFFIPTMVGGGAERVVSILSGEFVRNGYNVEIVVYKMVDKTYPLHKDIKLLPLCPSKNAEEISLFKRVALMRDLIKKRKPEYVISFLTSVNMNVCLATIGLPCKVIVSERNDPKQIGNVFNQIKRDFAYSFADKFVFQTQQALNCFSKRIQKKSIVILNPILSVFPLREKCEKRIVAVGRLNYQKNYPLLLKSFSKVVKLYPEYKLEIYGQGELRDELERLSKELCICDNVIFKGYQKKVHECIKDAGMYVMSSDFEGLPNALLEAMCMGIPCISTDCPCGGPAEVIENGKNGLLVPVNDEQMLFNAIVSYIENPSMASQIGENAKELAYRLEYKTIASQWLKFIEE